MRILPILIASVALSACSRKAEPPTETVGEPATGSAAAAKPAEPAEPRELPAEPTKVEDPGAERLAADRAAALARGDTKLVEQIDAEAAGHRKEMSWRIAESSKYIERIVRGKATASTTRRAASTIFIEAMDGPASLKQHEVCGGTRELDAELRALKGQLTTALAGRGSDAIICELESDVLCELRPKTESEPHLMFLFTHAGGTMSLDGVAKVVQNTPDPAFMASVRKQLHRTDQRACDPP